MRQVGKVVIRLMLLSAVALSSLFLPMSRSEAASVDPVIFLNGEAVVGSTPVVVEGTTLVPFRAIAELTGATVSWNAETRTATATHSGTTVQLPIGEKTGYVNGQPVALLVPATLFDGRTFVPLRFLAETFGLKVDWNDKFKFILLETPAKAGSSQSLLDLIADLGFWDGPVARSFGKRYINVKTGESLWIVSIKPDPLGLRYSWELILRKENGLTFASSLYKGIMIDDFLITYEEFEKWNALKGQTVWAWTAHSTRWPSTVKNLEAVIVTDVQVGGSGVTPVKITVEAASGSASVRIPSKESQINPWMELDWMDNYILTKNPHLQNPDWSDSVWQAISARKVFIGMTDTQAFYSWGPPVKKNRTTTTYGTHEQWVYGGQYLYFENGMLTGIQD